MPGMVIPSLLRPDDAKRKAVHVAPKRHERAIAQRLSGRQTPASGALPCAKGDVRGVEAGCFEFLVECKTTQRNRLRLEPKWLAKITAEAGPTRVPAIAIRFREEVISEHALKYCAETEADWVLIPMSIFERIQSALADVEDDR